MYSGVRLFNALYVRTALLYEGQSINSDNDQIKENLYHLCEFQIYIHTLLVI